MVVRELGDDDVDCLVAVDVEAHSPGLWTPGQYASEVSSERTLALGAFVGSGSLILVGMLFMTVVSDEAMITNVAVRQAYRRLGIGGLLLDRAMDEGTSRGVRLFVLEVRDANSGAKRLYSSRGFHRAGTRRNYYSAPRDDAAVMLCRIDTVVEDKTGRARADDADT